MEESNLGFILNFLQYLGTLQPTTGRYFLRVRRRENFLFSPGTFRCVFMASGRPNRSFLCITVHGSHPYAIKTQRKARNAPSMGLWVPWAVSLWHKSIATPWRQSTNKKPWSTDQWEWRTLLWRKVCCDEKYFQPTSTRDPTPSNLPQLPTRWINC